MYLSQLKIFLLLFVIILCDETNDVNLMQDKWSMIVSFRYDCQQRGDLVTHCCSGTILTESYILTSADCVDNLRSNVSLADMTIAAGIHSQSNSGQIIRNVDQIIIHPNWTNNRNGLKHNVALLHISRPLDFRVDKHITRICRPPRSDVLEDTLQYPSISTRLLAIKWDFVEKDFDSTPSANLQEIEVSLLDDNDPICDQIGYDVEQQFCARVYSHHQDSCNYEHGAPILQWIDSRWVQVGITNSVAEETDEDCRGIYTRLAYYHDWIDSVVNSENHTLATVVRITDPITKIPIVYDCNVFMVSCGCCMEKVELTYGRIIGGEEAVPYSWTMTVSIRLNDSDQHSCAGSILTGSYILTAAHCIDGASLMDISIAAGIHNRIEDFALIRYVYEIYIHPNWNGSDGGYRNDIAILRIFPPLNVGGNNLLASTCVSYGNSSNEIMNYPVIGSHLVIIGWGSTQLGTNYMSDTLQQASVYMIDNDDPICQQSIHDVEKQFCAGMYGRNPCQGDSGGPILQWKGNYWEQVGITSYGGGCDHIGSPGIYTRLAYYFDWIESVINTSLTTTTPIPPPKPASYVCNKTSSCGCGEIDVALTSSRIVGGEDAIEDSWPMMVSVRLSGSNDHSCGGTILSSSYILTAAHCFRRISIEPPAGVTIAAGMTNRSDPSQTIRTVDRIYMHPNYSGMLNDFRHDIALLHIDQPLIFEPDLSLTKTCIHRIDPPISMNQHPKNGTRLAVIGWGVLRHGIIYIPEILQQAQVFTIDNEDPTCLNSINNTEIQFCAGLYEGGKDSCQGDSGGPIFQWSGQYWEQVGIVSYGKDCAEPGFPGIYTRLSYYYHWMEEMLTNDGEHLEPNILPYETTTLSSSTSASGMYSNVNIRFWSSFTTAIMTKLNSADEHGSNVLIFGIVFYFSSFLYQT